MDYTDSDEEHDSDDDSDYEFDSDEEDSDEECSTTEECSTEDDSQSEYSRSSEVDELLHSNQQEPEEDQDAVPDDESDDESQEDPPEQQSVHSEDDGIFPVQHEPPRRSTRTRVQRNILDPSTKGQTHGNKPAQQHLHVQSELDIVPYNHDLAKVAVSFLQALRHRTKTTKHEQCHLVTYSLQKGIKKFQRKGFDAAKGEMKQLHDRECWKPIKVSSMSASEKRKALVSLIFLVEKKDGRIKARHCANGSKQRQWM